MGTALMEENTVSASKMTEANACTKKRNFAYKKPADDGDKSPVYYRSVIAIDSVINALAGKHGPREIMQYMSSRFEREVECFNKQEKPALCLYDHYPVARYIKVENRTPKYYRVRRKVMMGDIPVMASAHLGFESEGGKAIELVLLKLSKPNMTQKGRGNAFNRDFLIYSLILLGRKLGYSKVTASIYFLRKNGDSYNFQGNDDNFLGTNVISFEDEYKGEDTEWDRQMKGAASGQIPHGKTGSLKKTRKRRRVSIATCDMSAVSIRCLQRRLRKKPKRTRKMRLRASSPFLPNSSVPLMPAGAYTGSLLWREQVRRRSLSSVSSACSLRV